MMRTDIGGAQWPNEKHYLAEGPDGQLFVREVGEGAPLVVLHGGPGAHHDYLLPHFAPLAGGRRLIFYDQRGGGRSRVAHPSRVGWRDHVSDLEALRNLWRLDEMTLLGYSWGGLLALLYAAEYPDRVNAMVLVAPAAGWGDYHHRFKEEFARRSVSEEVNRMRAELETSGLAERDPEAYVQRRFDISIAGYFRDPGDAVGSTPFVVQAQAQQATWLSLKGQGPQLEHALKKVVVPTLVLHGRYDPIPLEWAEELADTLPDARLVVLDESGHVPHVEERDRTLGEIRRFLEELR
jgi:proline iminopeptidase